MKTYRQFLKALRYYYRSEPDRYADIMRLNRKHRHIRHQYDEMVTGYLGCGISDACLVAFTLPRHDLR